jgi:4-hydroxybenzoate polyprenyltransferase
MPQLILGIVYASGFLLATVHTNNISILQINAQDIQIYISLILWVIFYDTIYAKRDFHYDKSLKINSSAVLFAKNYK